MAKKKKSTKKKSPARSPKAEVVKAPSPVWGYTLAVIFILIGIFMVLGGFGTGGSLPKGLFHAGYWLLGWGAWVLPISLLYWGAYKFISEEQKLPLWRVLNMYLLMLFAAGWFYTAFATKQATGTISGGHGGTIGGAAGGVVLGLLDKIPASLLFFVFALFSFFFAFGISPKVLLRVTDIFKKPQGDGSEDELAALKGKAADEHFKMNEGVPVVHHHEAVREQPQLTSLKNTAQKLTPSENHAALTAASDPDWKLPSIDLLDQKQDRADAGDVEGNARIIKETLRNFSIEVEMEGANIGPRVTQYTLKPPTGVKLAKITALENNLALDLAATSIRMEAPIPGKRAVGIEVPNVKPAIVRLSSIFQSREWAESESLLTFAIGKDIVGKPVVADLAKMPHLLVAGQTGSGKSVMINDILASLVYRNSPSTLKLILVDPKQVELTPYNDLPHLLTPVINEPEKTISALKWAVAEMERRLRTMASVGKRNIDEYNALKDTDNMPFIIIVIDELSDLMMMAARDVEALIVRIAQKARAAGIHLILATQRPSVDVITGLIKANVPGRIAFTTQSQVDSRTIIDQQGANKLLGRGDMLLLTSDMPAPKRVQAAFISDTETHKVNDFIREQRAPDYNDEVVSQPVQLNGKGGIVSDADMAGGGGDEDMFRDAVRVVIENRKASTSLLQRRLRIGYGRAARLIEEMEEQGIIGQADGSRPREVLVTSLDQVFGSGEIAPDDADLGAHIPEPDSRDEYLAR
jgi:S-DNA-T family DNA segregation ATPase FtsK/SpoIIIE